MIRLATIGTSAIVDQFLSAADCTDEYSLRAVYSRKQQTGRAFADKHGCDKVFTDLQKMARWDGIDAVYIASPNALHAVQSRLFLENGKHVLCEKPIVTNAAEYTALKQLADERGLIYMEAIMPRHAHGYADVKKAVASIGSVRFARISFCQRSSRFAAFEQGESVNIFDMSLHAGALMDLGVYCVYAAVDFFGMPQEITATKSLLRNGADGGGTARLIYDGFSVDLCYDKTYQSKSGSEIIGENGAVHVDLISQYVGVTLEHNGKIHTVVAHPSRTYVMSGEAQRFADYISRYAENAADYAAASDLCYNVHRCMDSIKQAAGLEYPTIT